MNIYADRSFLPATISHTPMLYPFWSFRPLLGDAELERHRFEHYLGQGAELFNLTSLKESRFAVLPFNWEQVVDYDFYHAAQDVRADPAAPARATRKAEELAALSESENREVVVFFSPDSIAEVQLGNSRVCRTSIQRATRRPHEYAMPFWMPDEVEASFGGDLPLRKKRTRPVVGFCGFNPVMLGVGARASGTEWASYGASGALPTAWGSDPPQTTLFTRAPKPSRPCHAATSCRATSFCATHGSTACSKETLLTGRYCSGRDGNT